MVNKIALNIEQMKNLQNIGIDPSNASMVIIFKDENGNELSWDEVENHGKDKPIYEYYNEESEIWGQCHHELLHAETGNYDHSYKESCGTFTLQDILNILPKEFKFKSLCEYSDCTNDSYYLSIDYNDNEWRISYDNYGWEGLEESLPYLIDKFKEYESGCIRNESLLEAAYDMLIWVKENGFLK